MTKVIKKCRMMVATEPSANERTLIEDWRGPGMTTPFFELWPTYVKHVPWTRSVLLISLVV